jgi:hypothetical protein
VKLETLTVWWMLMLVEFRTRFAVAVSTEPSNTTVVPSDFRQRNHVAVPVAFASVSLVIALNVIRPPEAAGAAVALNRSSASSTCEPMAVSAVAGWVPS